MFTRRRALAWLDAYERSYLYSSFPSKQNDLVTPRYRGRISKYKTVKMMKISTVLFTIVSAILIAGCQTSQKSNEKGYITVQEQGSFAVGGTVVTTSGTFDPIAHGAFRPGNQNPDGQTLHGDHAFVVYQKPIDANRLPLVFWHGYGQSMKTWQTTPDGREGFQTLFLRRGFSVYNLDQPRRGKAGRSTKPISIAAS